MNRSKRIACVAGVFAGLIVSTAVLADGNGSGSESSNSKKESAATFCTVAPWLCGLIGTQNNGSGNEPPKD